MKRKIDNMTILMIALVLIFIVLIIIKPGLVVTVFTRPLVTVNTLPVNEPISVDECKKNGGILILPEQDCSTGYINWGYGMINGEYRVCCIPDRCKTGLVEGKYITSYNEALKRFERRCVCPAPKVYLIKTGCTQPYQ